MAVRCRLGDQAAKSEWLKEKFHLAIQDLRHPHGLKSLRRRKAQPHRRSGQKDSSTYVKSPLSLNPVLDPTGEIRSDDCMCSCSWEGERL
jgi:hypothetical protein